MRLKDLLIFIVLLSIGCSARAQQAQSFDYPWLVEVFDLPVSDNKVQYRLYVRAPLRKVDKNAPVHCYYFLDALSNFTPAAAMSYNYEQFNYMPTGFFIGVGYTNEKDGNARTENRTRDYTPSQFTPDSKHFLYNRPKDWQHSGGAPAFSRILKNQIIPFVENHYDIKDSSRTLIGKSMSGLAATYIALTQSDLFQQYLIISPSLWWDDWTYPRHQRAINKLATSSAAMAYSRSTRIYFAVGDDEERMGMVTDIYVLTNMLVKQQRPNLQIAVDVMTDMNHEGAFPQGFMRGIVGLFSEPQVKAHPIDKRLVWR